MSHKTVTPTPYREAVREYLTIRQVRERRDLEKVNAVVEIDLYTATLLRDELADADRREVQNLLVDLSRVDFLALIGVRILRAASERRTALHQRRVVSAPPPAVQRVLSLTDVTGDLEVYVSTPSARSALAR